MIRFPTYAKTVSLPHLAYKVRFRYFTKAPPNLPNALAYCRHNHSSMCTVYVHKKEAVSAIAHELTHVLRWICLDRNMRFTDEAEHMAYLMQYLMGEVLGYVFAENT